MYNEGFIIVDTNITPPMSCVHGSYIIFKNKASGCENLVFYVEFEGMAVDHSSLTELMFRICGEIECVLVFEINCGRIFTLWQDRPSINTV